LNFVNIRPIRKYIFWTTVIFVSIFYVLPIFKNSVKQDFVVESFLYLKKTF